MNAGSTTISLASAVQSAEAWVAAYDQQAVAGELDNYGCAVLPTLVSPRSHIHMARHGFGKGEYRYFKYPVVRQYSVLR